MAAGVRGSGKTAGDRRGLLADTYGAFPPSGAEVFIVALLNGAHWHIANTSDTSIFLWQLAGSFDKLG